MAGVKSWIRGSLIGAGAFGKVNLAVNRKNGELFAVKSIECSSTGASELKAIENEVEILQSLDSPYVVSCLGSDWSVENGKVMRNVFLEYMPGGSLADLMQKFTGKLDEALIRAYTRSILEGLNYLHSKGVVHCDIKGKNVLVGTSGVKLADFGAAKRIDSAGKAVSMESIKGTPLWMAPEVATQVEQGTASDIWSLGCTVVEMATGKAPWSHLASPMVALYHIGCTEDLPAMPTSLSKDGLDFLSKCFQRDAMVRWTAAQLLAHPFIVGHFCADTDSPAPATPTSVLDMPGVWDSQSKSSSVMNSVPILALKRGPSAPFTEQSRVNYKQHDLCMASGTVTEDWWCTSPLSPKEGQWITVRSPKPSSSAAAGMDMASPLSDFVAPVLGERVKLGLNFGLASAAQPEQAASVQVESLASSSSTPAEQEELGPTTSDGVLEDAPDAEEGVKASSPSANSAESQLLLQCGDGGSHETGSGGGSSHSQGCIHELDCAMSEGDEVAERRRWIRNFSRNLVSLVVLFTRLSTDSQNCFFKTKLVQSRMSESLGSKQVPGQVALCILLVFSKHQPPWLFQNPRLLVCMRHWCMNLPCLRHAFLGSVFVVSAALHGGSFVFFPSFDVGCFREASSFNRFNR